MRISEQTRSMELIRGIDQQSSTMSSLYQKLSTGKRVNQPSDDPVAAGAIMRTNAYIAGLNQNIAAVNSAQAFSQAGSDALNGSADIMSQIQTLAVQAANGTQSAPDLQAIGSAVNQFLESLVQNANSQFDGRCLFSGTRTDTAPISVTRDANGNIESFTYQGSDNEIAFPVGQGRPAAVSVTANAAYLGSGLLAAVKSLRDDLYNAQGVSGAAQQQALSGDLSAVNAAQTAFLGQAGELGSRQAQLTSLGQQMQTTLAEAQSILSNFQDADVAQVGVQLQSAQTVYQALLSSGAKMLQQNNLFNYL